MMKKSMRNGRAGERGNVELDLHDPSLKSPGLTVKFLPSGKVIFKLKGETSHFTLHPGRRSGVIDLHKTDELAPARDASKYQTIGKISQAELITRLSAIGPHLIPELLRLIRPIRLGWIMRRRLGIGPAFPPDSALTRISGIRVRPGNAALSEPFKSWMQPPEFYDEVLQHPGKAFYLFDCRKTNPSTPYGLLFTYREPHRAVQMKWIKYGDLLKWAAKWEPLLLELLSPLWKG
jgi:hypothetical protein